MEDNLEMLVFALVAKVLGELEKYLVQNFEILGVRSGSLEVIKCLLWCVTLTY